MNCVCVTARTGIGRKGIPFSPPVCIRPFQWTHRFPSSFSTDRHPESMVRAFDLSMTQVLMTWAEKVRGDLPGPPSTCHQQVPLPSAGTCPSDCHAHLGSHCTLNLPQPCCHPMTTPASTGFHSHVCHHPQPLYYAKQIPVPSNWAPLCFPHDESLLPGFTHRAQHFFAKICFEI